jgi:thiamine-monophosphate kinase
VQVLGEVRKGGAVLRRGARSGDTLFVSGRLGLSGLGLACVRAGVARTSPLLKRAVRAHFLPQPRLALAQGVVRRGVTSMIDLSDGLSTDLNHLCAASRVGARVYAEQIPAVKLPLELRARLKTTNLELALNAGEDYELLFTIPKKHAGGLQKKLAGVKVTPIGEITRAKEVLLFDARGAQRLLRPQGWDHFRRRPGAR